MSNKNTVTAYQWPAGSFISGVEIRATQGTTAVAYLAASATAKSEELHELRTQFRLKGWASSSDMRNGQPVLRLTGIHDTGELLEVLKTHGSVSGEPTIKASEAPKPKNTIDAIKKNTLRSSGIFYSIGNALMIVSGALRNRAEGKFNIGQLGSGLSFAAGDIGLMAFGGEDDARQFKSLLTKLKNHLHENNVTIPQSAALNVETMQEHHGFLESIYDFMHTNINTLKISAEVLGGALYAKGGIENGIIEKQIAGTVIVTGWLAALLIKEKKPDEEKLANAGLVEKAWAHIQQKPLVLAGGAGLIHNGISAIGAFNERARFLNPNKPNPKNRAHTHFYQWDVAVICAMLLGNSLYAMSQKTTGGAIKSDGLVDDVYGIAAQILNKQSPETQEAAIQSTAQFLGERPEIKDSRKEIVAKIHEKMRIQRENPWFENVLPETAKPVRGKWSKDKAVAAQAESPAPQR